MISSRTGYERIPVLKDFCMKSITGTDGVFQRTLKFTDEGVVEDFRSDEFHKIKEMLLFIGEFLLQSPEFSTTVINVVRGQRRYLFYKQGCCLIEKTVLLYSITEMHFHGLHLFPFLGD